MGKFQGAGRLGSIKRAKQSAKGNSSSKNAQFIGTEGIEVRFLTDPEDFIEFYAWFDNSDNSSGVVMEGEDVPEGASVSKKYLANCFVRGNVQEVKAVQFGPQVLSDLLRHYDKNGTIMDRDFELSKTGSGLNTKYHVDPDSPGRFSKKVKLLDLDQVLVEIAGAEPDDEDEEEEKPRRSRRGTSSIRPKSTKSARDDDDDDEDEDEWEARRSRRRAARDDDDEEEETPRRRRVSSTRTVAKKSTTRSTGRVVRKRR